MDFKKYLDDIDSVCESCEKIALKKRWNGKKSSSIL